MFPDKTGILGLTRRQILKPIAGSRLSRTCDSDNWSTRVRTAAATIPPFFRSSGKRAKHPSAVSATPLGIPAVGRGKGIAVAVFSLISRHPRAARDSQPPTPNTLSGGGWELRGWRLIGEVCGAVRSGRRERDEFDGQDEKDIYFLRVFRSEGSRCKTSGSPFPPPKAVTTVCAMLTARVCAIRTGTPKLRIPLNFHRPCSMPSRSDHSVRGQGLQILNPRRSVECLDRAPPSLDVEMSPRMR